jgi:hypothetical protein
VPSLAIRSSVITAAEARRVGQRLQAGPEALNAPLFHSLMRRLEDGGRWVVLDLGAARGNTIQTFGHFRCRLDIVDLADGLEAVREETEPRVLRQRVESLLLPRAGEATDIVLCWDLINYLSEPALTAVMECIAVRCKPGALAHGLVYYSMRQMPERPGSFVPLEDQKLANLAPPGPERPAPRYSPEDLARCMPRYTVERGRLLRNGMQEFLFRL